MNAKTTTVASSLTKSEIVKLTGAASNAVQGIGAVAKASAVILAVVGKHSTAESFSAKWAVVRAHLKEQGYDTNEKGADGERTPRAAVAMAFAMAVSRARVAQFGVSAKGEAKAAPAKGSKRVEAAAVAKVAAATEAAAATLTADALNGILCRVSQEQLRAWGASFKSDAALLAFFGRGIAPVKSAKKVAAEEPALV